MTDSKEEIERQKLLAELRKAEAEADDAENTAAKNRREEAEASTPAAAAQRASIAEKNAAEARRASISALIPDPGKIQRGSFAVEKEGNPTAGTGVAGRAVRAAADALKRDLCSGRYDDGWRLLVTTDQGLAASDAAYWDAVTSLERLTGLADQVLSATTPTPTDGEPRPEALPLLVPVISALAQAVPGILSLLSTNRTLTSGAVTIDDLTASVAVAGVLKGENRQRTVHHDAFRTLPPGPVLEKVKALRDRRQDLLQRKIDLQARVPVADDPAAAAAASALALVTTVGESIDEFLKTLGSVPDGGTLSPLTAAVLRQGLHDGSFTHVLLVKSQSASAMQIVGDKAFRSDPVAVLAAATISWIMIEAASGAVLDAGVSSGTAQATGTIGNRFHFDDPS